jgi:DNA-binding Lrp family transcriptional regulator
MPELLDRQLLHALQIYGRQPFSLIANTIGVSDQTVARRYRRLRAAGLLRVQGLLEPSRVGRTQWIVRIRSTPNAAKKIAGALAGRVDTSWISLIAGGTEIVCVLNGRSSSDEPNPLLEKLPLSSSVLGIDAQCVLHEFFGGTDSLINKCGPLNAAQVEVLKPPLGDQSPRTCHLDADDEPLLRALAHDGRATATLMASKTGWSESKVRRRIAELVEAHILYFDVDFDQRLFDLQMRAVMWLRAPTDQLAATAHALADHPEVGYVAATTGATNLYCAVSCATPDALYGYLTDRVGQLSAIQHLEVAPVMRSVKGSSLRGSFTSE